MSTFEQRRADLIKKVKLVLAATGVPQQAFARTLSNVIGVAIAQAYRKLNGASDFTLPQIEAIEAAYGVEIFAIVLERNTLPPNFFRTWSDAAFAVGAYKLPCQILVGAARKRDSRAPYAAYLRRGVWQVCIAQDFVGDEPLFELEELRLQADAPIAA